MPKLVINPGTPQARELELKPGKNTFGRGFGNDFKLEDASVSAMHAEIVVESGSVTVRDLRSTNGTFINRSQIREAFLQPGQTISFGAVEMVFGAEEAAADPTSGVARTVALPQVGGIKIARPAAQPMGGMMLPQSYPAPTMPTPNLNTGVTATQHAPPAPAQAPAPVQAMAQQAQTPMQSTSNRPAPQSQSRAQAKPQRADARLLLRCLGFGFGTAVLTGAVWIAFAALEKVAPTPYSSCITGLLCGAALRIASRNRGGMAFALLAAGYAMLAMFLGACGEIFAIQHISFTDYNLAGLIWGIVGALLVAGWKFRGRERRGGQYA